jgi:acyl carrier protein
MRPINTVVRSTLAHHLECQESTLSAQQLLLEDLDLTPLELVIIAVEVEEIAEIALPFEQLEGVRTVGDLLGFFARAEARRPIAHASSRAAGDGRDVIREELLRTDG